MERFAGDVTGQPVRRCNTGAVMQNSVSTLSSLGVLIYFCLELHAKAL